MRIIELNSRANVKEVQGKLHALGIWTSSFENTSDAVELSETAPAVHLLTKPYSAHVEDAQILAIDGVQKVYLAKSEAPKVEKSSSIANIGGIEIGDQRAPILIAGPCSVEGEEQIFESALMAKRSGAKILRGGCFKPRSSPYSFRGAGLEGLQWMEAAAKQHGLLTVTEVMSSQYVDLVAKHVDMFQIGARNMQNFDLLHAIGRAAKPVLLKRGFCATIEEWLQSAEHLLHAGSGDVVFCERGVRGFDSSTRFMLDLGAVALLSQVYKLPVLVDPSHAAGRKDLIPRLGLAALAAGAHGLIVEAHPNPEVACSDAAQQFDEKELLAASSMWGFCS